MDDKPIVIVGGGVIGLSIGWQLARAGESVILFERGEAGRGASWKAGGMLAPDAESHFEELDLYRLCRESLKRWPDFARILEAESGHSVDYRDEGTLMVADDRDSAEALHRIYSFQKQQGYHVEWLSGAEALELEPFLAPRLAGAVFAPEDHQVDNRRLVVALKTAFLNQGGELREHTSVLAIEPHEHHPVVVLENGNRVGARLVVVAAGAWSRQIEGIKPEWRPPVRPVKGQVVELKVERPFDLKHVVRGPSAYVIPKSDGRLLIGATSEEMGFDTTVTAGGLYSLLEGAWEIVPGIYDLPVTDTWAGLRPGSRDNGPLLGHARAPGILFATGHYRNGILLTPITAEEISRLILGGETSSLLAPFSPLRFETSLQSRAKA